MTNETKIKYLQRAGICYIIAGVSIFSMGIPFWFFGKIATDQKIHQVFGILYQVDNFKQSLLEEWGYNLAGFLMLYAHISFWKIGEPTGMTKRNFLLIPIIATICHIFSIIFLLPFAPVGSILLGLGMTIVGIFSIRLKVWTGWKCYTPLFLGLFPLVVQAPIRFILGLPPYDILPLLGIALGLMGFAAWQRSKELGVEINKPN
ncbi:MAG: hypothetical protein HC803_08765 [Saprospiraceae bacterium]|nr:hypothetical protein [Saprospiraceae bacterium]